MNIFWRTVVAIALPAVAALAQAPPREAPTDEPRARVRGRVIDATTRAPVKGVQVVIGRPGQATASAEGSFDGSFDIADAPSGEQQITAHKSGYSSSWGRVRLPAGSEIEDVRIEMNRTAVITGRVLAANGSPLPGAEIRLLQPGYERGTPTYRSESMGLSDDRGVFRMWRLDPGDYMVKVEALATPGPQGSTVYDSAAVYYPNASTLTDAARLHLDWGQIREGIDLQIGPPAPTRVEGSVRFAEAGGDCSSCSVELRRQEGAVWVESGGVAIWRNAFTIAGLATGRYVIRVLAWDRSNGSSSFGAAEFVVVEDRTSRVTVEMRGEQAVSGRVVLVDPPESIARPNGEAWRSTLHFAALETDPLSPQEFTRVAAEAMGPGVEAAFSVKALPGRYYFGLYPVPGGGYVRSASVAGRPIEGPEIEVPPSGLEDVVLSIAYDAGKISGKVDLGKTPPPEAGLLPQPSVIQLFAESKQAQFVERLFGVTKPDGSFEIDGLPPGRYRALARTEDIRRDGLDDPTVASKLAPWSKQVEIRAGQTTTLALKPAPRLSEIE
jgi:hypothetical protein